MQHLTKGYGYTNNQITFFYLLRNAVLEAKGFKLPKAVKTGTTIVGIVYKV